MVEIAIFTFYFKTIGWRFENIKNFCLEKCCYSFSPSNFYSNFQKKKINLRIIYFEICLLLEKLSFCQLSRKKNY